MANVIVLFEVTIKEGRMDDYLNMAASLKEELAKADGFIGSERFESLSTKGKLLSKSEWKTRKALPNGAIWQNTVCARKQAGNMISLTIKSRWLLPCAVIQ